MPSEPTRLCSHCQHWLLGEGPCVRCFPAAPVRREKKVAGAAGRAWRNFRWEYLVRHPWCQVCGAAATQVESSTVATDLSAGGFDATLCRSVCASCADARTPSTALTASA